MQSKLYEGRTSALRITSAMQIRAFSNTLELLQSHRRESAHSCASAKEAEATVAISLHPLRCGRAVLPPHVAFFSLWSINLDVAECLQGNGPSETRTKPEKGRTTEKNDTCTSGKLRSLLLEAQCFISGHALVNRYGKTAFLKVKSKTSYFTESLHSRLKWKVRVVLQLPFDPVVLVSLEIILQMALNQHKYLRCAVFLVQKPLWYQFSRVDFNGSLREGEFYPEPLLQKENKLMQQTCGNEVLSQRVRLRAAIERRRGMRIMSLMQ